MESGKSKLGDKKTKKATLVLHSGDYDKVYSALIIGNGALAMGMDCSIFFTFWGLERLKKGGLEKGKLSKMHLLGIGKWFMKKKMKKANVTDLRKLIVNFRELGGKVIACDMTMEVMGCSTDTMDMTLIDECAGVGTYISEAKDSEITLFI